MCRGVSACRLLSSGGRHVGLVVNVRPMSRLSIDSLSIESLTFGWSAALLKATDVRSCSLIHATKLALFVLASQRVVLASIVEKYLDQRFKIAQRKCVVCDLYFELPIVVRDSYCASCKV